IDRLTAIFPAPHYENKIIWTVYLAHARYILNSAPVEEYENIVGLRDRAISCFFYLAAYKEAEHHLLKVLNWRRRTLGKSHPDTLTSMGNLASIYCEQGRWKEAEELEVKVVEEMSKTVLGELHPHTLTSM